MFTGSSATLGAVWASLSVLTAIVARFGTTRWLHMGHSGIFSLAAFLVATLSFFLTLTKKNSLDLLPFSHLFFVLSLTFLLTLIAIRLFLFGGRRQRVRLRKICILLGIVFYSLTVGAFSAALTEVAIFDTHFAVSGQVERPPRTPKVSGHASGSHTRSTVGGLDVYVRYGNHDPAPITVTDPNGQFRFFVRPEDQRRLNTVFVETDTRKYWCPKGDSFGEGSFIDRYVNFSNITPGFFDNNSTTYDINLPTMFYLEDEGCEI